MVEFSHSLKVLIAFENSKLFNVIHIYDKRDISSDTVQVVPEVYILKMSFFVVQQRLVLHQNGVEFCQLSIDDIRISLAAS